MAWLRSIDQHLGEPGSAGAAACVLGLLAHRTPAWTERYVALLDRLDRLEQSDDATLVRRIRSLIRGESDTADALSPQPPYPTGEGADAATPELWTRLFAGPLERCPQIVDVDFPTVALTRAEWVNGCLNLSFATLREDRKASTTFRIVGAEPRIWCMTGIDGAKTDVTSQSVIVRMPLVSGNLEFTPGSY